MIIDRIFSLMNNRTLSATTAERVLNAEHIKYRGFAFEKVGPGQFNIVPTEGLFSFVYVLVFRFQAKYQDGECKLVSKIRLLHVAVIDFYLFVFLIAGLFALLSKEPGNILLVLLAVILMIGVISIQMMAVQFLAFNEIESALRQAEYVGEVGH